MGKKFDFSVVTAENGGMVVWTTSSGNGPKPALAPIHIVHNNDPKELGEVLFTIMAITTLTEGDKDLEIDDIQF